MAPHPSQKGKKGKGVAEESTKPAPDAAVPSHGILEELPEPVASFDISDIENIQKNYDHFVERIIESMKDETDVKFKFQYKVGDEEKEWTVPVTPGSNHTAGGTFVFELKDEDTSLRVVCDKYQLWFRGIVTSDGKRYEIKDDTNPKVMVGSKSLHTDAMYPSLLGEGKTAKDVKVGYQALHRAIHELAKHGEKEEDDEEVGDEKDKDPITSSEKEAIATILVMCFEAPRLKEVCEFCSDMLKDMTDGEAGVKNKDLINTWSNKSRDFYGVNGDKFNITLTAKTQKEIMVVYNGVTILCQSPWDRWVEKKEKEEQKKPSQWKPSRK